MLSEVGKEIKNSLLYTSMHSYIKLYLCYTLSIVSWFYAYFSVTCHTDRQFLSFLFTILVAVVKIKLRHDPNTKLVC